MKNTGRNAPCPCSSGKPYQQCCEVKNGAKMPRKGLTAHSNVAAIEAALQHHQAGRLSQAEAIYRQILETEPMHADALQLLGVMAHQLGKNEMAVALIAQAIGENPAIPMYHGNLANALQALGRLPEAVESYRKAIALKPDFAEAHSNLGNALKGLGRVDEAVLSYRQAIALQPGYAEAHYNLATTLKELGELNPAIEHYYKALALKPNFFGAYSNLGNVLKKQGRLEEAVASYRQAISCKPDSAVAHYNLGLALRELGKPEEAVSSYRQAVLLKPDFVEAHVNLGLVLHGQGRFDSAADSYRQAIRCQPACEEAYCNLGVTFRELGRQEEAVLVFREVLRINPGFAEAHYNLGNTLQALNKADAAVESYSTALALRPDYPDAHNNLGNVLQSQGRLEAAAEHFQRALALRADDAEAHNNLGNVRKHQVRLDEAIDCYRLALTLNPDYVDPHSNLLYALSAHCGYTAEHYLAEARRYGDKVSQRAQRYTNWLVAPTSTDVQRLRVGFVSGDLKEHPVGYFLESILSHLNPERVDLFAYATRRQDDALTARIKPRFRGWHSIVGLSDEEAARKIHEDGLHILIDLAGHTAHNRLPVFAWKPAPVQVSWLGYFASTGLPAIDYVLADPVSVPEAHRRHFTETVCYLADTRLCFTPPAASASVAPLPALRNGYLTFGCFQMLSKISDQVLAVWGRIFQALPQARLRLQNKQMSCERTREQLMGRLRQVGIAPERITLQGPAPRDAYLAAHAEVDILLDTFPYPGGTTTCEALWMGVPTMTLAGDTMLARQGASLLACAGLTEWIASDELDYVNRALFHASDIGKLAQVRAGLRQQALASPLFDAARFAVQLENALFYMWQQTGVGRVQQGAT